MRHNDPTNSFRISISGVRNGNGEHSGATPFPAAAHPSVVVRSVSVSSEIIGLFLRRITRQSASAQVEACELSTRHSRLCAGTAAARKNRRPRLTVEGCGQNSVSEGSYSAEASRRCTPSSEARLRACTITRSQTGSSPLCSWRKMCAPATTRCLNASEAPPAIL